jgi:hypothetical protein
MTRPLLLVVLISWGIALVEYCFAVPANRIVDLAARGRIPVHHGSSGVSVRRALNERMFETHAEQ